MTRLLPLESALRAGGTASAAVLRPVARQAHGAALATLDLVLESKIAAQLVERVTASRLTQRALSGVLEGPLVEALARDLVRYRVADRLLSEGLVDQTATRVLDGPELERVVEQLLESKELWLLVEEVARSPAVTAAITRQSVGFADQVAGGVRARSRSADAWLERGVRRALRRPPAPGTP
jgi:hypothetical protein